MSKSVMLVEDSAVMRKIIIKTIKMANMDVSEFKEAGNGEEALKQLQAGPVDVMLCDINMPGMNGVELIEKVRQNSEYDRTKIVIVSTEGSKGFIENMRHAGVDDYITKPFTAEAIRTKLQPLMA